MDISQKNEPDQSGGDAPASPGARQDLSFLWPVIDRIRAVEIKFTGDVPDPAVAQAGPEAAVPDFAARLAALEAEIAAIKQIVQSATTALGAGAAAVVTAAAMHDEPAKYPARSWKGISSSIVLSVALLLLAHWLIIIRYDHLPDKMMLASAILIPLAVAIVFTLRRHIVLRLEIPIALAIGMLAVFGMSYVLSIVEKNSWVPQNLRELYEILEYIASISFAYFTGVLLSSVWQVRTGGSKARMGEATLRMAQKLAKATGQAVETGTKVGKQVKSIQDLINFAMPAGTAVVSVITGIDSILK